jgi:hypothetical protein
MTGKDRMSTSSVVSRLSFDKGTSCRVSEIKVRVVLRYDDFLGGGLGEGIVSSFLYFLALTSLSSVSAILTAELEKEITDSRKAGELWPLFIKVS